MLSESVQVAARVEARMAMIWLKPLCWIIIGDHC